MSALLVPLCTVALILYGLCRRVRVYQAFSEGASEALPLLVRMLPYMAAMLVVIQLVRQSGLLADFTGWLSPVLEKLGVPPEVVPLILLRPFSGGAAVAMVSDIMDQCGSDSYAGYLAGILMGSSETVFYTLSLYFGAAGVTKSRYTIPVALLSMTVGVIASVLFGRLLW